MGVNENAGNLTPHGAPATIASKLAPTETASDVIARYLAKPPLV